MPTSFTRPQINFDERMLWIHAGPHKAASSYITERLRQNRENLFSQGILLDGKTDRLGHSIAKQRYEAIDRALGEFPDDLRWILLSSPPLDDRILSQSSLEKLEAIVDRHGFKLGVSYFIRDQQSWLNSVYCHRVRRFRETLEFPAYCDHIMSNPNSWDITYPSKFRILRRFPKTTALFLPLSKQVPITDPFLALVDALGLQTPVGDQGWRFARSSKENIQPGARGVWMSALCRRLMVEMGFDPEALKHKGKFIRDVAIERGWDRERFDGFDQSLQDRVSAFYASSNEAFAQEHWGVCWNSLFPMRPAAQRVYAGPQNEEERKEMRSLMVRVLRELRFPWRLRRRFFSLYDATV